ncbi:MAG: hypothetical protein PHW96_04770 [Candidatus Nanoarchaeia archaeon]|nr:hypothetical protein [Candidatus Nanoarchaeia archaeon]
MKRAVVIPLISIMIISAVIAQELTSEQEQAIQLKVQNCVNDVSTCDCSDVEEGKEYCEKLVNGAKSCLANFESEACQSTDPTKAMVNGVPLKHLVRKRVHAYDTQITDCINSGAGCDCSQFPESVREFCENKAQKQSACLNGYDLDACIELENPDVQIFPDFTPYWLVDILEPIIRPLVRMYQEGMRNFAIGSAMQSIGVCFADPYNCDCSSINYYTIRADCEQRARLMRTCLNYRDCGVSGGGENCTGIEACNSLTQMPLVPEVTPAFMKPFIEPVVLQNVCPMMEGWPYDKGNYASCG